MKRSLPDINVWFALSVGDHPHHASALAWWNEESSSVAGFTPLTQIGLLRLLTTASAMGGAPLTNDKAWKVYDTLAADNRVRIFPELPAADTLFRTLSCVKQVSPKIWADAYLAAHAAANEAILITFDRAFSSYGVECRVLD